jgi:hypothetical protein
MHDEHAGERRNAGVVVWEEWMSAVERELEFGRVKQEKGKLMMSLERIEALTTRAALSLGQVTEILLLLLEEAQKMEEWAK